MGVIEKSYILIFRNIKRAINPVKRRIMKTECEVHKFINNQAIVIMKNDGFREAYTFLQPYLYDINDGVVWADQDLKSSNHFYNPHTDRGLYGNSNARVVCMTYYRRALSEYFHGDKREAMFYLGAACHLIQDLTVPQHANVRLLDNHRSYEKYVINVLKHHDEFKIYSGGIYLNSILLYVCLNSRKAIKTYKKYSHIKNQITRFYRITSVILVMAQRTTAGLMYKFYRDIRRLERVSISRRSHSLCHHKLRVGLNS